MKKIFVNCASHRARENLTRELGYKPKCFYKGFSSTAAGPNYAFEIDEQDLPKAREIKGVTVRRDTRDLNPCWG